jgi:hypothetical protein
VLQIVISPMLFAVSGNETFAPCSRNPRERSAGCTARASHFANRRS